MIQKGKATKNTINYYLDKNNIEDNLHMNFYCNDKRINISEILKANTDCEVVIYSIYGSMEGIEKIWEYMNIKMKNRKYTIKEPLKYISCKLSEEDNELYRKIYNNNKIAGKINVGDYKVIREYNQPKHNIMSDELLIPEKVIALFCKRAENY